jgi:phosphoribosylformylglycinamidine synthase
VKAKVHITLKSGVLDPQGKAIHHALDGLGFKGVEDVRQGKVIEIKLKTKDKKRAKAEVEKMCRTLLANTIVENFTVDLAE